MELLPDLPLYLRITVATTLTYLYVIVLVRASGKRTVASLTSFDWILNVALGSLIAVAMTNPDKFWETNLSILLVVALQWIASKAAYHSRSVARLLTAEPTLLVHEGQLIRDAMARARVNEDEIATALRGAGVMRLDDAGAVIMETGGSLKVLSAKQLDGTSPDDFARRELHGKALEVQAG